VAEKRCLATNAVLTDENDSDVHIIPRARAYAATRRPFRSLLTRRDEGVEYIVLECDRGGWPIISVGWPPRVLSPGTSQWPSKR